MLTSKVNSQAVKRLESNDMAGLVESNIQVPREAPIYHEIIQIIAAFLNVDMSNGLSNVCAHM